MIPVTDLLAEMMTVDSVNGAISGRARAEAPLGDAIAALAGRLGLPVRRFPVAGHADDLLLIVPGAPGARTIVFESHLDTVGVAGMTVPPFAATRVGDRIFGRGACDTKGSGAAMLHALARRAAAPVEGSPAVALLFSVDEEIARAGIDAFIADGLGLLPGAPAAAIVGEPTGLRAVIAHTGVVRQTIRTTGVAAHSSDPTRGRSAIRAMLPVLTAFEERYLPSLRASHPLTGPAVGSVNVIRGGEQVNIIPAVCEIEIDRRVAPGEDVHAVAAEIRALLAELRAADPRVDAEVVAEVLHPTLDPAIGRPLAAHVRATLEAYGLPGEPVGTGYGTDASAFAAAGIPAVVLGPGSIEQAHTADEWVPVAELETAAELYLDLMTRPLPA